MGEMNSCKQLPLPTALLILGASLLKKNPLLCGAGQGWQHAPQAEVSDEQEGIRRT